MTRALAIAGSAAAILLIVIAIARGEDDVSDLSQRIADLEKRVQQLEEALQPKSAEESLPEDAIANAVGGFGGGGAWPQPTTEIKIFRLQHAVAQAAIAALQPLFQSNGGFVAPHQLRMTAYGQTVFARGTTEELRTLEELLDALDEPVEQTQEPGVLRKKYEVTGMITCDDQPIVRGEIFFEPAGKTANHQTKSPALIEDGRYTAEIVGGRQYVTVRDYSGDIDLDPEGAMIGRVPVLRGSWRDMVDFPSLEEVTSREEYGPVKSDIKIPIMQ